MTTDELAAQAEGWIEATVSWLLMSPGKDMPDELEAVSYTGCSPQCIILVARYRSEDGTHRYAGTVSPTQHVFCIINMTPALAEKAFLKAETTLKK